MGNNLGKTNNGKQQKQRNQKQKRILQGSREKGIADSRSCSINEQSYLFKRHAKRVNKL